MAVTPQLPALPLDLAVPVAMPGLDIDTRIALLDHRVALQACRRQVVNLAQFYAELANGLGGRSTVE